MRREVGTVLTPRLEAHAAEMRARNAQARREQWDRIRNRAGRPRTSPRVSGPMAEVLARMAAGHEMYLSPAGFWVDTYSSEQRATVLAMQRRGWIEPVAERRFRLTEAGRAVALAVAQDEPTDVRTGDLSSVRPANAG
jgi:hypothetical protein